MWVKFVAGRPSMVGRRRGQMCYVARNPRSKECSRMKEGRTLPVIQPGADAGLSRRAALQTLAAGIGASMAVPGLAGAEDHPVHKHVAQVAEQARKPGAAAR